MAHGTRGATEKAVVEESVTSPGEVPATCPATPLSSHDTPVISVSPRVLRQCAIGAGNTSAKRRSIRTAQIFVGEDHQVSFLPPCSRDEGGGTGFDRLLEEQLVWRRGGALDDTGIENCLSEIGIKHTDLGLLLLHQHDYDTQRAVQAFKALKASAPSPTRQYARRLLHRPWTPDEIQKFEKNIVYIGKDFLALATLCGKTEAEAVQFYYEWKNKRKILRHGVSWKEDLGNKHKLLGKEVEKFFDGFGLFRGTVVAYFPPEDDGDEPMFRVKYEDGDKEDYFFDQLCQLLVDRRSAKRIVVEMADTSSPSMEPPGLVSPSIMSSQRKRRRTSPTEASGVHTVGHAASPRHFKFAVPDPGHSFSSDGTQKALPPSASAPRPLWQRYCYRVKFDNIKESVVL
jgi:hypothetical protein